MSLLEFFAVAFRICPFSIPALAIVAFRLVTRYCELER
jgi:hypothetical protein